MLKDFAKILLAAGLLILTIIFPLVKILTALLFVGYFIWMYFKYRNWTFLIPSIGGSMNLVAILSNRGKMPVLNPPVGSMDPTHTFLTAATHVKPLCDLYPLGHLAVFSFGDIFIAVIWPLTVLGYMWYRKYRRVGK